MGSLSNLFISQSYISLLHLGSDNTASTSFTEIEDGLGNGIGVSVNTDGGVSASNLAITNNILAHRGLEVSGTVKINTEYTSSTPSYVNSGNYFTDSIIRITGSFASGTLANPTINEVQIGWIANGNGISNAVVTDKQYVNSQFVEVTINQNTAVWFGEYSFTNPTSSFDNVSVSGSQDITGSLWVRDNITTNNISASGNISASNLYVSGTIYAFEIDTTIVSSSIVFTSGSNIIGDEANVDTQTLVGRVIVTGSLEVTGSTRINGNVDSTGSLKVTSDISSSTISGLGNATLYSASVNSRTVLLESTASYLMTTFSSSVDSRLDIVEATASLYIPFSTSVNSRLINLENFSSSLVATFATVAQLNASSSQLQSNIDASSSVLQSNINTKLDTASFNSYTSSLSSSTSLTSASFNSRIVNIVATGATTASNNFVGNQVITGSLILSSSAEIELGVIGNQVITGSLRGNVTTLSVSSQTASMDCSLGNFFTLTLPSSSTTFLTASNIRPGETIQLRVQQGATTGSLVLSNNFSLPTGSIYQAINVANKSDILSFVSFDTTTLYSVFTKAF